MYTLTELIVACIGVTLVVSLGVFVIVKIRETLQITRKIDRILLEKKKRINK